MPEPHYPILGNIPQSAFSQLCHRSESTLRPKGLSRTIINGERCYVMLCYVMNCLFKVDS